MPYIKKELRGGFDHDGYTPTCPGELNYFFTSMIKEYIYQNQLSYQTINDVIGALEAAKLEFYRRIVSPYEDKKIQENGDVY